MRGKGNAAVQRLQQQVRRAQELIDNRELCDAQALLLELRNECQAKGIRTAQVPWMLGFSSRIRGYLTAADRPASAEDTPKLYELLQELGEADLPCHLAMARWEAAAGKAAEALKRLDAVLLLAPYAQEAWALKAEVAAQLGDAELQRAAEVEAAALGAELRGPLPFAMPGIAEG